MARYLRAPDSPVSRQYINQLVKKGVLKKDADGLIDIEEAKQALLNRVHPGGKTTQNLQAAEPEKAPEPAAAAPATEAPDENTEITSYHIAKTLREAAEAQIARLKLAEMRGEVIQVEAVRAAWARRLAGTRDAILQIPIRVAPILAAETSIEQVSILLETELRQALAELNRDGLPNATQSAVT